MSVAECRQGFAAAARLIDHNDRSFIVRSYHMDKSTNFASHSDEQTEEYAELAEKLAATVDGLEAEVESTKKELREQQKDSLALYDHISKLASDFETLAGILAAKKNERMPTTSRLERSLAILKQKLESLEGSNVSQTDLEAREKEIAALKAENTKLMENVRDAHADRQRALEDNESLRQQLQKARAEKHADGSGKKKKSK
ncbi:hypothetical protein AAVH_14711 [Aphelenchoides avenae]|nr:hypothetical protein AAVH_14711 [Aphelenchus avenae]